MKWFSKLPTVVAPARTRAESGAGSVYSRAFWSGDDVGVSVLNAGRGAINPELALTLPYVYSAVSIISDDFGTMPCQFFKERPDGGRDRVRFTDAGIGSIAYLCQWQPNQWQTAKAFWSTLAWQYLLRPAAYAEIIYRPGSASIADELIPRHPDRVTEERLPNGRIRFALREAGGTRYVTQDEMLVVRNTSTTGLNAISRVDYAKAALSSALSLQDFTRNYFHKGATAALIATYKGSGTMEEADEAALHASMSRYLSGSENAGGLLLVPEDIDVKSLGVDPEKSQLLGLKNLSGRDVARMFKIPPSWLGIEGALSYGSQVQDATNYINRCQAPMIAEFEQAIKRDLVVAKLLYFAKFNMDAFLRSDLKARMESYEIGIRSRVLWPSEARQREDMNPDERLDQLSEGDNRPGAPAQSATPPADRINALLANTSNTRLERLAYGFANDNALRCIRRERLEVEKLARQNANNVDGWKAGLRAFYAEHAGTIAQTMRVPMALARAYAAGHGTAFEENGVAIIDGDAGGHWEREEAQALAELTMYANEQAA